MRLYDDLTGKGTYATPANAVKRIEEVCKQSGIEFRYIIGVTGEGRFFPVVIPRRDEQYLVGTLAHMGICVTF